MIIQIPGLAQGAIQNPDSRGAIWLSVSSCRSECLLPLQLRPRQRSAEAASACFGATGMNHDEQDRLLDEANAKVRKENQARRFTLDFSLSPRQFWQASRQNLTPRTRTLTEKTACIL